MLYVSHHNLKTTEKDQYLVLGDQGGGGHGGRSFRWGVVAGPCWLSWEVSTIESRLAPMFISERLEFICADGKRKSLLQWCGDLLATLFLLSRNTGSCPMRSFTGLTPTLCPLPLQLQSKYDPQKEAELRSWIEGLTGLSIGPDFQKGLKDGIILCT